MRHFLFAIALAMFGPLVGALPAHAQATRTWVSGVGDDANPCSRTAPCKTFAGAISKTAASGEINCLDSGGFGAVTITKALTILCDGVVGGILSANTNGIIINAGATDVVNLKGLDIDSAGTTTGNGIRVIAAGSVNIIDCTIRNANGVGPANGSGILFNATSNIKFSVTNTSLYDMGNGSTGAGILINPNGAFAASGVIDRVTIGQSAFGIAADATTGASGINVTVQDSSVTGSPQAGIVATTNGNGVAVMVTRSAIVNNGTGLLTSGANATIRVGSSSITGNTTGVSGTVLSYGNNQLNGNGSDGTLAAVPGGLH